ncbi:MAG: TonB-dependent receptor plug protein [Bacteroidetes bacterium]|nr:TonB-dependent receptor plug protein [Bacteroidota bacterium]
MCLRIVYSIAAVTLSLFARAQLSGRVIEIAGKDTTGIVGATLFWKNTSINASTDAKGYFKIESPPQTTKLVVSYIGYKTDSLKLKPETKFVLIKLKPDNQLGEIEVVYERNSLEMSYLDPRKLETLTERSLMKAACCNLSESFETNPSVDVNFADAVSGAKQIQLLGLSGQYAQITKENMPYLRGLANGYGLSFIPGTWIHSIQLGKGAGSVINGYESFTGQINTELQNPHESEKLSFNSYVNENLRNEYNLNLAHRFNPKFSVGLLSHLSYNPMAEDKNNDAFLDIPTGEQQNGILKFDYNSGKMFEAQFGGGYLNDQRRGGQSMMFMNRGHHDTLPLYDLNISNRKWEVYSKTGLVFQKKPGTSMGLQMSYLDHELVNNSSINTYSGVQRTFYANYIFQGIINNTNHTYRAGLSYLNDEVSEKFNSSRFYRQEIVPGAFTEYAYSFKTKFNMVAGLRGDYHNIYGFFLTPRLHMRWGLNDNKTIFRISGGRALRTSSIFSDNMSLMASNRYWALQPSDFSMPYGLRPETAWNYGLNFTQKFELNYREAYVTLDVYRTDFVDQVIVDLDSNTQEVNIYNLKGQSFSNTAQFEFGWEIRKRLFIKAAYRFVDNRQTLTGKLLEKPFVSRHRAFINFEYTTKKKNWMFDGTCQYNGSKRIPSTESNPVEYRMEKYSPDFYNVLAQITYLTKLWKADFNVYLGVENALNYKQSNPIISADNPFGKYFDASMVWGPIYGRMLYAGLRLKIK